VHPKGASRMAASGLSYTKPFLTSFVQIGLENGLLASIKFRQVKFFSHSVGATIGQ